MADSRNSSPGYAIRVAPQVSNTPRIPVIAFGMSLGLFLAITFVLCVGFDLIFPGMAMYQTWLKLLPGFTWLSIPSFLLGLVEDPIELAGRLTKKDCQRLRSRAEMSEADLPAWASLPDELADRGRAAYRLLVG